MANDKDDLIIVPKPGQLLTELGAIGALADAAKDVTRDYIAQIKLRDGLLSGAAKIGFDWGAPDESGVTYKEKTFKNQYFGTWPPEQPEVFDGEAIAGGITKQNLADATAVMAAKAVAQQIVDEGILEMLAHGREEDNLDIAFWYYRNTELIYSLRRVSDNFFYDFATKHFMILPHIPRAGMPRKYPVEPSGYIYSTRLSGKLADGEYVITIRDSNADDVVVGIAALFMKDGAQQEKPLQGLENTPIEEGIPEPAGTFRRAERPVRPIDTGGSET